MIHTNNIQKRYPLHVDLQIDDKLASFIDNYENFQSTHDLRQILREKEEYAQKRAKISEVELEKWDREQLIKFIFKANCHLVDRFFRKDYVQELMATPEDNLRSLAARCLESELLLVH